jgi:hypothetical protein
MISHITQEVGQVPPPARRTENVKKTVEEHRVVRKVPNRLGLLASSNMLEHSACHATCECTCTYISRQSPLTRTIQYQIERQGADKNPCGLTSCSSLFPRVHTLQFVAENTFADKAFCQRHMRALHSQLLVHNPLSIR